MSAEQDLPRAVRKVSSPWVLHASHFLGLEWKLLFGMYELKCARGFGVLGGCALSPQGVPALLATPPVKMLVCHFRGALIATAHVRAGLFPASSPHNKWATLA